MVPDTERAQAEAVVDGLSMPQWDVQPTVRLYRHTAGVTVSWHGILRGIEYGLNTELNDGMTLDALAAQIASFADQERQVRTAVQRTEAMQEELALLTKARLRR